MIRSILVSAVLVALSVVPRVVVLEDGFLPQNNLKIAVGSLEDKGISRKQFDQVMDRIEAIYGPEIKARGGNLVLKRLWDDETVNASAQREGNDYVLNMYGGLARHESITQDGMALVVCHEMGHHLGGAPKYGDADWASNEGEADYFANLKCLRRMFAGSGASFTGPKNADPGARPACEKSFKSESDRALCVREAAAGMSVTTLFRILRNETVLPRFDTPDPAVVTEMYDGHPGTQCRLDTYFAGSICARAVSDQVSDTDLTAGTCTPGAQASGFRPLCWFKPPTNAAPASVAVAMARKAPAAPSILKDLQNSSLWQGL